MKATTELEITLKPGEELQIQRNYGVKCEIIPVDDNDEPFPVIPWHELQSLPESSDFPP